MLRAVIFMSAVAGALQAQTTESASPLIEMDVRQVFPQLEFAEPVMLTHAGDGSNRLFAAEKPGVIKVFPNQDDVTESGVFLDISDQTNAEGGEAGLLGLAFHPQYADNGKFYVHYTRDDLSSRVALFRASADDPNRADPASERVILDVERPTNGHNGGSIAFGADGFLYWGLGDGSGRDDAFRNGQNRRTLLGAILRLDVDGGSAERAYGIPADNPLVGNEEGWREELWAWGLRNPWRFSFDRLNSTLWAGDVGQNSWEEVDIIEKGGNYGWRVTEGLHCFSPPEACDTEGFTPPVVEYGRDMGSSVIGGYVYRGPRLPRLQGVYLYGDFGSRRIWGLRYADGQIRDHGQVAVSPSNISSFGEDEAGEVYIVNIFTGKIYVLDERADDQLQTSVATEDELPDAFGLAQNHPNPFNAGTTIDFELAADAQARLDVSDLLGRKVRALLRDFRRAGTYQVHWDGRDDDGRALASGVYLYRLRAGEQALTRKLLLVR